MRNKKGQIVSLLDTFIFWLMGRLREITIKTATKVAVKERFSDMINHDSKEYFQLLRVFQFMYKWFFDQFHLPLCAKSNQSVPEKQVSSFQTVNRLKSDVHSPSFTQQYILLFSWLKRFTHSWLMNIMLKMKLRLQSHMVLAITKIFLTFSDFYNWMIYLITKNNQ